MATTLKTATFESIEDSTPLVDAALTYASYGIPVFPVAGVRFVDDDPDPFCFCEWSDVCPAHPSRKNPDARSLGKHPYMKGKGGFHHATTHAATIKAWWNKWPHANVGIQCGRASKLLVIDVDDYKEGSPSLSVIIHDLLRLEHYDHIPFIRTGSGGTHLLFRHPMTMEIKGKFKEPFKDFVDLRADGTYILAPPSLHRSGERYKWLTPISKEAPLFVPKKFVAAFAESVTPASNGSVAATVSAKTDPATHQQIEACLTEAMRKCTKKAESDASNRLMLLANCVNRHNLSDGDGLKAYARWGQTWQWPKDFTDDEVLKRFRDAAAKSPDERGICVREAAQQSDCIWKWDKDYVEREVTWMWQGWIPHDKVSLLAGLPGVGKSFLTCLIAAHAATGAPFPTCKEEDRAKPVKVIILNREDGVEDTQLKRLRMQGAGKGDVAFLESVQPIDGTGDRMFNLQHDIAALKKMMAEIKEQTGVPVGLIIWDPIDLYLGPGVDVNSRIDVGGVLSLLVELSKTEHVVNLGVHHINKTQGITAVHRLSGSSAFASVSRAIHYFTKHPTDKSKRLLVASKLTNAVTSEGLEFSFVDGVLQLSGVTDLSAEEMLGDQTDSDETYTKKKRDAPAIKEAKMQIKEQIIAAHGSIRGDVLKIAVCGKEGEDNMGKCSEAAFDRARAVMGLHKFKVTDEHGVLRWWVKFATDGEKF